MVKVTDNAIEKLIGLMMSEGITPDTHNLRVGVTGGGCSGLQYEMDFDDTINEKDTVIDLEVIKVVINPPSLLYLAGTTLDFNGGLNGKGFEWINPNANRTCGCGESFSL
jgi:iron-sulfur cluster assembly protein